jgi:hypothetical protein
MATVRRRSITTARTRRLASDSSSQESANTTLQYASKAITGREKAKRARPKDEPLLF